MASIIATVASVHAGIIVHILERHGLAISSRKERSCAFHPARNLWLLSTIHLVSIWGPGLVGVVEVAGIINVGDAVEITPYEHPSWLTRSPE